MGYCEPRQNMEARAVSPDAVEGDDVNDSLLFLALATIFGLAMLTVGWQLRAMAQEDRRRRDYFTSQNSGV